MQFSFSYKIIFLLKIMLINLGVTTLMKYESTTCDCM